MVNNKHILTLSFMFFSIFLLYSCDTVENNELGTLRIEYTGIKKNGNNSVASFLFVNDTTKTVSFRAYDGKTPVNIIEVLTDTGWSYRRLIICGTGLEPVEFKPGTQKTFTTPFPTYNCTWRAVIGISVLGSEKRYAVKSKKLEFTLSEP